MYYVKFNKECSYKLTYNKFIAYFLFWLKFVMMNPSFNFKAFRIVEVRELGDSRFKYTRSYELIDEYSKELGGVCLGEGCAYLDESGLHTVYLKIISGIKSIYLDDQLYTPVPLSLEDLFYYKPYLVVVYATDEGKVLEIYRDRSLLHRFKYIEKGFVSKRFNPIIGFEHGSCCGEIYVVAKTSDRESFVFRVKDDKVVRENIIGEARILGWNRDWLVLGIREDDHVKLIVRSRNSISKFKIPINMLTRGSFRDLKTLYVNDKEMLVGVLSGNEFRMIDLDDRVIVWSKLFSGRISSQFYKLNSDRIAIYSSNNLYVFDPYSGSKLFEYIAEKPISSVLIRESFLLIALGENIVMFSIDGPNYREIGSYYVDGNLIDMASLGDDVILVYYGLSNVLKTVQISIREGIEFGCSEAVLVRNTSLPLPLHIPSGKFNVKVLKRENKAINVESRDEKFYIVDRGSDPGIYDIKLLVTIPGSLPTIVNLKVRVEDVKSAIRKLKLQSLEVSPRGFYFPLSIETLVPLNEVYVLMYSRNLDVFGSSFVIQDLPSGEHSIPVHIIWGKSGTHNVTLAINGWSMRNRLYEEVEAKIKLDYDILPLYARFYNDAMHIWSPAEVGEVNISVVRGSSSYVTRVYIGRGWNELEETVVPDEVVIELPSRIECCIRRGESWLRFKKH